MKRLAILTFCAVAIAGCGNSGPSPATEQARREARKIACSYKGLIPADAYECEHPQLAEAEQEERKREHPAIVEAEETEQENESG